MEIIKTLLVGSLLLTGLMGCKQEPATNKTPNSGSPSSSVSASEVSASEGKNSMADSGLPKIPSASDMKKDKESQYKDQLTQMRKIDPEKEAKANIAAKRFILKATRARGLSIPGVDRKDYKVVQAKCQLEYLKGMGDVIYGSNHLKYRLAIEKQAAAYNQIMLTACQ